MLNRHTQSGVTLVELIIGVAIVAILLGLAAPSFSLMIQNTQNRSAAESVANGLQLARAEAVKRNSTVRFDLTDGTGLVEWKVGCELVSTYCPTSEIRRRYASEGAINARVGVSTAVGATGTAITAGTGLDAGVSFNSMGRIPSANIGTDIQRVDVTNAAMASARRFVILIDAGGQIRMCDPALVFASNPQGCN